MIGSLPRRNRRTDRFPDGFREWFYELRTGLRRTSFDREHGTPWRHRARYTLGQAACGAGIHRIGYGEVGYSSYAPPEHGWSCDRCGYERYPYRAVFWQGVGRLGFLGRAWYCLRHPIDAVRAEREWRSS